MIERKQVGNILFVILQVFIIRFLHLDNAVFQLDKHHRQAVNENQNIRAAIIHLALDPHLRHGGKGVVFGMFKINQFNKVKILSAVFADGDFDVIANLLIELIVGGNHIRTRIIAAKLLNDRVDLILRNVRIQLQQRLAQHLRQHALSLVGACCSVVKIISFVRVSVTNNNVILKGLCSELVQDRLFYIVFGNKVAHSLSP